MLWRPDPVWLGNRRWRLRHRQAGRMAVRPLRSANVLGHYRPCRRQPDRDLAEYGLVHIHHHPASRWNSNLRPWLVRRQQAWRKIANMTLRGLFSCPKYDCRLSYKRMFEGILDKA